MRNINLNALRAFVAVMQYGTLTEAAERIFRTQPTTTRLIATLEDDLGLELFVRKRQRLTPTRIADAFYREALRILATIDDIPRITEELKQSDVVRVQAVTHPRIADNIVSPAVAKMVAAEPNLSVKIETQSIIDIERWLFDRRDGIALTTLPVKRPNMISRPLFAGELVAIVPKHFALASAKRISMDDLDGTPVSMHRQGASLRTLYDKISADTDAKPKVVAEASSSYAVGMIAIHGGGIALMDSFFAIDLMAGRVNVIPIDTDIRVRFGLIWNNEPDISDATRRMVDAIVDEVSVYDRRVRNELNVRLRIEIEDDS